MKKNIEEIEKEYYNLEYLLFVKPTYIENWTDGLRELSIKSESIKLTEREIKLLGASLIEYGEGFKPFFDNNINGSINFERKLFIEKLRIDLNSIIKKYSNGSFIRLGSRSPKDSYRYYKNSKVMNGDEAINMLIDTSERMYDDLMLALINKYESHIFVREWIDIPKWCEFRCFMKNRQLQGISQYYYQEYYKEIEPEILLIQNGILEFFKKFEKECHLDDVIFDVFLSFKEKNELKLIEKVDVKLIEINPYSNKLTDPCLYNWFDPDSFNTPFRYQKEDNLKSIILGEENEG